MMTNLEDSISLIIPVYAEGTEVYQVLESHYDYLSENFQEFEMIIALDGNDAETHKAIREFKEKGDNIHIHHSSNRRGKGGAILDSFSIVNYPLTAISDADISIAPSEIGKLVSFLKDNNADIAIGSRYVRGSKRRIPLKRLVLSRFFNVAVRTITGLNINDTQCGTKVISSKFLPDIIHYQTESGWAFDVQMLFILKSLGANIIEVPISWVFADGSRMKLSNDVPNMFLSVLRARSIGNLDN